MSRMDQSAARFGVRPRIAVALAVALSLAAPLALSPSPAAAGSLFSTNGLGETTSPANGRSRALGGVAVPFADPMRISLENPASAAVLERVSFTALYQIERRSAENDSLSETFSNGTLPVLFGAVPIKTWVVLAFGMQQEQEAFVNPLRFEGIAEPVPHSLRYKRSGDVFRVPIALAKRVRPWLSLGASLDAWFGSLEEERRVEFAQPGFRDTEDRLVDEFDGTAWSAGILVEPKPGFAVGFRRRAGETLTGTRTFETIDGGSGASAIEHSVPESYAVGAAASLPARGLVAFEVRRDLWGGEEGDSPAGGGFIDVTRFGGGIEIFPSGDENAPALRRRPWRAGFRRAEWHVRDTDGDRISEWFLTAGTAFSLGGDAGRADLFVEYGRRGSVSENGLQESVLRAGLGFSGGEPWKKPTKGRRGSVPSTTPTY